MKREKNLSTLGGRLASERERLGLNQDQLGALVGKSRRAITAWESGEQSPNAMILIELAAHGLDTVYVLTGRRQATVELMSAEEEALLDNYRHAGEEGRAVARAALSAVQKPARAPRKKAAGGQ